MRSAPVLAKHDTPSSLQSKTINSLSPHLIIPKEGPMHDSPANQFMNPTWAPRSLVDWASFSWRTNKKQIHNGWGEGGVYKPVRGREKNETTIKTKNLRFSGGGVAGGGREENCPKRSFSWENATTIKFWKWKLHCRENLSSWRRLLFINRSAGETCIGPFLGWWGVATAEMRQKAKIPEDAIHKKNKKGGCIPLFLGPLGPPPSLRKRRTDRNPSLKKRGSSKKRGMNISVFFGSSKMHFGTSSSRWREPSQKTMSIQKFQDPESCLTYVGTSL